MSVRILALGDLHIQPNNLADINIYLFQLDKYLASLTTPLDLIIILGDTLHTHEIVHTMCLNKMYQYIDVCEKYALTYILVGNHELVNEKLFLSKHHPFTHLKNVVDKPIFLNFNFKGKRIVMSPYVPDGRFCEALNTLEGWKSADCIFGHQTIDGAKMGAILVENVEKWELDYPMLITGHIHDRQQPQPNVYYTGSSIQVGFGESGHHTIALATINDDKTISIEEIDIHPPRKMTLYTDIANINSLVIPKEENLKVRVSISGDEEEFKTFKKGLKYPQMLKDGVKVVFKHKKNVHSNLPTTTLKSFDKILYSLLNDDPKLISLYHQVIDKVGCIEEPAEITKVGALSSVAPATEIVFD